MENDINADFDEGGKPPENEPPFELSPEQATGFGGAPENPGRFNRKRVMILLCAVSALAICSGLAFSTLRSNKKSSAAEAEATAGSSQSSFLSSLRDRAAGRADSSPETEAPPESEFGREAALPQVSFELSREAEAVRGRPPPQPAPAPAQGAAQDPGLPPAYRSPLVPAVEGSLFAGSRQAGPPAAGQAQAADPAAAYLQSALAMQNAARPQAPQSEYSQQNAQDNKQAFYNSSGGGGAVAGGRFLGENAVWIGTVIPGVLETAINTDLPGNVLARVTHNIYDSQTGKKLLIPQGTVLIAKYNSSVSYAQHRVQIVWDTMVRPDGYQLDLEGMNSVDSEGMSGQRAVFRENWFEYLKAAGVITMFSLANAGMADTAARYAGDSSASAVAGSNSDLVSQLGGGLVSRAMNIQPTLTVANGTLINIMLNKTVYLPPAAGVFSF